MFKSKFKVLSLLKSFKYNNNNNIRTFRYQAKGISDKYQLLKNELLVISDEIRNSEKPVVALESTIITHGLPYPINLETALEVENEIRSENAIPATIAFLNGKLRVGLNKTEIEQVAKSHENALKISRRDLAYLFANHDDPKLVGGTTVSGTCIAAHAANIPIFCTGGIGGVHRDYTTSMDVSADLQELARTPVAVVSSGIKSILDIQRTLEYLETLGVCVYTLAESGTKELPAFFTSHSGFDAPYNCRNEIEAARMIHANLSTGLNMGMLIGVPIPSDHAANSDDIETAIQESLIEAKKLNIKGKKVTQFLLEKINKLTKGSSLASNIALIKNNARTSAKIAIELRKLQKNKPQNTFNIMQNKNKSSQKISLIGGINLDSTYKLTDEKTIHLKGVTQPVLASSCLGGVARNMAEALIKLGAKDSILFSSVARDVAGKYVTEESNSIGFDTSKWLVLDDPTLATGSYNAIFDTRGELLFGCGDMRAHNLILPEYIEQHRQEIEESALCIIDADIPVETILFITNICEEKKYTHLV
jgi:pseudouridine-5'-phosphate glycosidase/pseudouridine kinase